MSVGLLALLDDVAALAKVAAASLDDVASQAMKASVKAAGAVIDDAAVTPSYVQGFEAKRELPIIGKIALGSIKNKMLFLLPAALILSYFFPWAITPLLMIGGAYLCYEGAEKVFHLFAPHEAAKHEASIEHTAIDPMSLEEQRVAGAIKTDFILSAEIMTIVLSSIDVPEFWSRAAILAVAAVGITVAIYGVVAIIVKADDFGLFLAKRGKSHTGRAIGRGIVIAMPHFMKALSIVGTAAMTWVGGSIIAHGLYEFGITGPDHFIDMAASWAAATVSSFPGVASWFMTAFVDFFIGLAIGALMIPVIGYIISPLWGAIKGMLPKRTKTA
jgi:predicted DNA repair protein MutK